MKFLLNRRITICMLFLSLTLLGYVSYKQLPVELAPNAELPTLNVSVNSQQDMDPAYVESEVIIPLVSSYTFSIRDKLLCCYLNK